MRPRHTHWLKPPGPIAPGLRIGLLGGSFNPAHEGHLHVSEVALKRLGLDYVWWLVAPHNPLKPTIGMAPLDARVSMAAQTAAHPRILVMDIEAALGTRYTIDTLGALERRFPQLRFVWLMGSDNLDQFRHWRRWHGYRGQHSHCDRHAARQHPGALARQGGSTARTFEARRSRPHRVRRSTGLCGARRPA